VTTYITNLMKGLRNVNIEHSGTMKVVCSDGGACASLTFKEHRLFDRTPPRSLTVRAELALGGGTGGGGSGSGGCCTVALGADAEGRLQSALPPHRSVWQRLLIPARAGLLPPAHAAPKAPPSTCPPPTCLPAP
jgi:hypothetical protein